MYMGKVDKSLGTQRRFIFRSVLILALIAAGLYYTHSTYLVTVASGYVSVTNMGSGAVIAAEQSSDDETELLTTHEGLIIYAKSIVYRPPVEKQYISYPQAEEPATGVVSVTAGRSYLMADTDSWRYDLPRHTNHTHENNPFSLNLRDNPVRRPN